MEENLKSIRNKEFEASIKRYEAKKLEVIENAKIELATNISVNRHRYNDDPNEIKYVTMHFLNDLWPHVHSIAKVVIEPKHAIWMRDILNIYFPSDKFPAKEIKDID